MRSIVRTALVLALTVPVLAPAGAAGQRVTERVSQAPTAVPSVAAFEGASADGARVFLVTNQALTSEDGDTDQDVYERADGQTRLLSDRVQAGTDGADSAFFGGVSQDGLRVFFETREALTGEDGDTGQDVYERAGGQTRLLSDRVQVGPDGADSAGFCGVSDDGTRVFFVTREALTSEDGDTDQDVYERAGGQTRLLSDRVQGGPDAATDAFFGGVSTDGARVFFVTTEALTGDDGDTSTDVYESAGGQTRLLSDRVQGGPDTAAFASFGGVSDDGARVFFRTSEALTGEDGDAAEDVYERAGGQTRLVSDRVQGGPDAATDAFFGGVSADGAHVFFDTSEPLTGDDGDTSGDAYERAGGQTQLVSDRVQAGVDGADWAFFAGVSDDGARVLFETSEALTGDDGDQLADVYERAGGRTQLLSDRAQAGADAADAANFKGVSSDGARVFFETIEALTGDDGDTSGDVYERAGGQTQLVSDRAQAGADAAIYVYFEGLSSDGSRVFFGTDEALTSDDADAGQDVYVARFRQPPETTIDLAPAALTSDATADVTFTASEPGSRFECRVDGAAFAGCPSPFATGVLADGAHSFEVRAIDAEGDVDVTPAMRAFVIDTQAPGPPSLSGPTGAISFPRPTFTFAAEAGARFECRFDGAAFAPCASPLTSAELTHGAHVFAVRAIDAAGNLGPPAERSFTVLTRAARREAIAPVISAVRVTNRRFATLRRGRSRTPLGTTFTFVLSEAATVRIRIDKAVRGRRAGRRCVSGRRRGRPCTRFALAQNFGAVVPVGAGANRVAFPGRVAGRRLPPGSYRATLVATDPADNRSQPVRVAFAVVR